MHLVNNLTGFGMADGDFGPPIEAVGTPNTVDGTGSITLPAGLAEGDFVIVGTCDDETDIGVSDGPAESGYTEIFRDNGYGARVAAWYKFMGATPDTSATGLHGSSKSSNWCMAYRYVNSTNPFNGTTEVANGGFGLPNAPSMTTTRSNILRVVVNYLDDDKDATMAHSWEAGSLNTINFLWDGASGNGGTYIVADLLSVSSGAVDPPVCTGAGNDAWQGVHFGLRRG